MPGHRSRTSLLTLLFASVGCSQTAPVDAGADSAAAVIDLASADRAGVDGSHVDPVDGGAIDLAEPFQSASHPAFPNVPNHGGALLAPLTLVTIVAPNDPLASTIDQFGDAIPSSTWWSTISSEYQLGTITHEHVVGPALSSYLSACGSGCTHDCQSCLTTTAMKKYVGDSSAGVAAPIGKTIFLFPLPAGVTAVFDATIGYTTATPNYDCSVFTGFHAVFDVASDGGAVRDGWAFVQNCHGQNEVTRIASHEIVEAATDTNNGYYLAGFPNQPWTHPIWHAYENGGGVELGDLCEGTRYQEGSFNYQRSWSNVNAQAGGDPCIPTVTPYNNVSAPSGWYSVSAGGSTTIPLTGWSTAPMSDWALDLPASLYGGFTAEIQSTTSVTLGGSTFPTINNGRPATLTVHAPAGATSGEWMWFEVRSRPTDWQGAAVPATEDNFHYWPIGIYVP